MVEHDFWIHTGRAYMRPISRDHNYAMIRSDNRIIHYNTIYVIYSMFRFQMPISLYIIGILRQVFNILFFDRIVPV